MHTEFFLIIITIALSAFFSGAEVAIVATSKLKAEQLAQQKVKNSRHLLRIKNMPNEILITILIGNNIMNVASSAMATVIAFKVFENMNISIITGVMTLLLLTFGEILPKTFVANNSKKIALTISPFLIALYYLFYPLVKIFSFLSSFINKITGNHSNIDSLVTEREIKYLVDVGEREGAINSNERIMINKVFKLDDLAASKIMTPSNEIFSLDWNLTVEQAAPLIIQQGYSRLPIHSTSKEDIKGMITIQDVFGEIFRGNNQVKLKSIMSPVYFVNKSKKLDETLKELQLRNCHMAIVVSNSKRVVGLITLEDILEEIVGEIFDEEDKYDSLITKVSDVEWMVKGKTFIRTINKKLNVSLPLTNEFKPLSKFLQERMDKIEKGKSYVFTKEKVSLTIMQAHKEKIHLVSIKKLL